MKQQQRSTSLIIHVEDGTLERLEAVRQTLGMDNYRPHYDLVIQKLLKFWENEHDDE